MMLQSAGELTEHNWKWAETVSLDLSNVTQWCNNTFKAHKLTCLFNSKNDTSCCYGGSHAELFLCPVSYQSPDGMAREPAGT